MPTTQTKPTPTTQRGVYGQTAQADYQNVEVLITQGLNKTQAFRQVAEETGRSPGAVAASYYRMQRQYEQADKANGHKHTPTTEPPTSDIDYEQVVRRLLETAQGLMNVADSLRRAFGHQAEIMQAQQAEIKELQERAQGMSKIKEILNQAA